MAGVMVWAVAAGLFGRVGVAVSTLAPGYFSLVMATGIVSVGLEARGYALASDALLWLAVAAFVLLLGLTGWRLLAHRAAVFADFTDPRRGFGFFTVVAGANVLGMRLAMDGHYGVTGGLLAVAVVAWLVPGHLVPWAAVLGRTERPVLATANGTWFLWVVASQSVAVAAATLQPVAGWGQAALSVLAIGCWSIGGCLYVAAGILVALRMLLYELRSTDLDPSYWIAMGASAITVLAGSQIVEMADAPMVAATRGLTAGASVVFWAFATWLFPVLIAAGWWRHRTHGVPLTYDPSLWGLVFPLGMYSVASIHLAQADGLPLLRAIGGIELWVAVAAWVGVFAAMLGHLTRTVLLGPRKAQTTSEPVRRP